MLSIRSLISTMFFLNLITAPLIQSEPLQPDNRPQVQTEYEKFCDDMATIKEWLLSLPKRYTEYSAELLSDSELDDIDRIDTNIDPEKFNQKMLVVKKHMHYYLIKIMEQIQNFDGEPSW